MKLMWLHGQWSDRVMSCLGAILCPRKLITGQINANISTRKFFKYNQVPKGNFDVGYSLLSQRTIDLFQTSYSDH